MKRFLVYFLVISSTSFSVNFAAAEVDTASDTQIEKSYLDEVEFKSDESLNNISTLINIAVITLILLAITIGLLLAANKYRSKLPILASKTSKIDLIEYKKLPGSVEIYLLKIDGEDLVLAKNNNNVVSMDLKRTGFNEK